MLAARLSESFARRIRVSQARRTERRVPHRTRCCIVMRGGAAGERLALSGETVNMSESGVAVILGEPLPTGAIVEVMLQPVEGETTLLFGEVTRGRRVTTGTFEIGIRVTGYSRPG